MRWSADGLETLLGLFAVHMSGGSLRIYQGQPPSDVDVPELQPLLVSCPFGIPAFSRHQGRLTSGPIESTITQSGTAGWAQLVTSDGTIVADLLLASADDPDVSGADVIINRTDLQRGGQCTAQVSLSWPA